MREVPNWMPEKFSAFWERYPRKNGKYHAIRLWDKLKPSELECTAILSQLDMDKRSEKWKKSMAIPYAAAWLNQRPWIQ